MNNYVKYIKEDDLGILKINRPEAYNSLCNKMVEELESTLTHIEKNLDIKVLIITGEGEKAFMSGADIKELVERDYLLGRYQTKSRQEAYNRISNLPIPTIAAINGFALGAGLELALACTIRIAGSNAKLASPEVNLGIIPGDGATQRLPRIIGLGRAMDMILTGKIIDAETALNYGLVTMVVPQEKIIEESKKYALKLMEKAPLALEYAKEAVNNAFDVSLSSGLALESYLHALSCATEDKKEGIKAFIDKRRPDFTGK